MDQRGAEIKERRQELGARSGKSWKRAFARTQDWDLVRPLTRGGGRGLARALLAPGFQLLAPFLDLFELLPYGCPLRAMDEQQAATVTLRSEDRTPDQSRSFKIVRRFLKLNHSGNGGASAGVDAFVTRSLVACASYSLFQSLT